MMLLAAMLLAGCGQTDRYEGAFDLPHASAVLPADAGPFHEPIAYVANRYDGQVRLLAVKSGRYLTDDAEVAFARSSSLSFGRDRVISSLATWTDGDAVHLFAADAAYDHLVRATHIESVDEQGTPVRPAVTWEVPTLQGEGDATLVDLEFKPGFSSSETWTIERSGDVWTVKGSRSGRLETTAVSGEPYIGPQRAIAFTIQGDAQTGARFEVAVDAAVQEFDVGGTPLVLATAPDQSAIALTVQDRALGHRTLRFFDPVQQTVGDSLLPADAVPARMEYSGDTLWVSDTGRPSLWEVQPDRTVVEHVLPFTSTDVAVLPTEDAGWAYLASADGRAVWLYDLATDTVVDVNPSHPGVDPQRFDTPVQGLTAIPLAYPWLERNQWDTQREGRTVAVTLQNARLMFMEEATGCLLRDTLGPRTSVVSSASATIDYQTDIDGFTVDGRYPFLLQNEADDRHVQVHPCGGVARNEVWTLTFRRNSQAWQVEGSVSGLQQRMAFEDQRYVSDDGSVSFVVRAGGFASQEGWRMSFGTDAGIVVGDGGGTNASTTTALTLPGDPLYVEYMAGPEGEQTLRPYVIVVAQGADSVARLHPANAIAEVEWW